MLLRIDARKPDDRRINKVVDCIKSGGIIIYPTDTVYTLGCDLYNKEGYTRLCQFKNITSNKANFSIICHNLSQISEYCNGISTSIYKLLNRSLPGPYTFILPARKIISKLYGYKKATIGIRIPKNAIASRIVESLGNPLISTSIKNPDEILEYFSEPEEIFYEYKDRVDIIVNGGIGSLVPSTIIDLTEDEPIILREGKGLDDLELF